MCYLGMKDFKNFSQVKIKNQIVFLTKSSAFLLFIFFQCYWKKLITLLTALSFTRMTIKSFWNHFEKIQANFIPWTSGNFNKAYNFFRNRYVHHEQV